VEMRKWRDKLRQKERRGDKGGREGTENREGRKR